MAQIEKTVFISYRRSDVYTALAVYQDLKNHGYDVFFDYRSIASGDFEQIITSNIRARAHFILILTPTALDRLNSPGDWLRREIETAIDEKRNIVPLFFRGFRFGVSSTSGVSRWLRFEKPDVLTGKLKDLSRYNGLNVHEDYFDEAMHRLRNEYLNKPLDTVLHPVSNTVQRIVKEEQIAVDKALEQIDDVKELVKHADEMPEQGDFYSFQQGPVADSIETPKEAPREEQKIERQARNSPRVDKAREKTPSLLPDWKSLASRFNPRVILGIGALLVVVSLAVALFLALRNLFAPSAGSTKIGKDGATLVYVPAGEFTMGSDTNSDEQPIHQVNLDAFWMDQTEVTNKMYSQCVEAGVCEEPISTSSWTHSTYYGNTVFDDYPVIYVDWNMAKTYCDWAERRLPTEAEWEKAARGTDGRIYPWGNEIEETFANYSSNTGDTTAVGSYETGKSFYGAYDMAGNVWEWVSSSYQPYPYSADNGRENLDSSDARVFRGGNWRDLDVRSAERHDAGPTTSFNYLGFRCAVSANRQANITPLAQTTTETPSSSQPTKTDTPLPTETSLSPTPTLGIGSTMPGEDGMTLLYVPAGEFTMGATAEENLAACQKEETFSCQLDMFSSEEPPHTVFLYAFWIDQTEVTNTMYAECVQDGACDEPYNPIHYSDSNYADHPVVYVSWNDANNYCSWANRRLPTEAEWEKSARGIDGQAYPWGNNAPNLELLNYNNRVGDTATVGSYPNGASPYGALDMAGNVYEWVSSLNWAYPYSATDGREDLSIHGDRVLRGGSWVSSAIFVYRSTTRNWNSPSIINYINNYGFRCAMSATP